MDAAAETHKSRMYTLLTAQPRTYPQGRNGARKIMFGYSIKRFILNWFIVTAVLVIGAASILGYNSIKGSFDFFTGLGELGELFGGWAMLGAILVVVVAVGAFALGLYYLTKTDYAGRPAKQIAHIVIGLVIIGVAVGVGLRWIEFPDDDGTMIGVLIGAIIVVTVATLLVTHRTKKVIVAPAPSTTPPATPADPETSTTAPTGTAASS
jgi:hypothetical protein